MFTVLQHNTILTQNNSYMLVFVINTYVHTHMLCITQIQNFVKWQWDVE